MSISFAEIPADNLVPMFMTEFDNSNAAKGGAMPWKNLLVGQALSTASASNVGTLKQITSDEQGDALFGAGSQIARMIRAFRKNTRNSELWALALADAASRQEVRRNPPDDRRTERARERIRRPDEGRDCERHRRRHQCRPAACCDGRQHEFRFHACRDRHRDADRQERRLQRTGYRHSLQPLPGTGTP